MDETTAYTDGWSPQPDAANWTGSRRPTDGQWVLVAAVWLLAMWSSQRAPGWAFALVPGQAKSRWDQQWPETPPLSEIADVGDLPAVTGATALSGRSSAGPAWPSQPTLSDEEAVAGLAALVSDVVAVRDRAATH